MVFAFRYEEYTIMFVESYMVNLFIDNNVPFLNSLLKANAMD